MSPLLSWFSVTYLCTCLIIPKLRSWTVLCLSLSTRTKLLQNIIIYIFNITRSFFCGFPFGKLVSLVLWLTNLHCPIVITFPACNQWPSRYLTPPWPNSNCHCCDPSLKKIPSNPRMTLRYPSNLLPLSLRSTLIGLVLSKKVRRYSCRFKTWPHLYLYIAVDVNADEMETDFVRRCKLRLSANEAEQDSDEGGSEPQEIIWEWTECRQEGRGTTFHFSM